MYLFNKVYTNKLALYSELIIFIRYEEIVITLYTIYKEILFSISYITRNFFLNILTFIQKTQII